MSNLFKDRQPKYPNRYKITNANGDSQFVTLERADEPTVEGTPLNAITLNQLLPETGGTMTGILTLNNQMISQHELIANTKTILNDEIVLNGSLTRSDPLSVPMQVVLVEGVHYGSGDLPDAGTPGRIFFKKVN